MTFRYQRLGNSPLTKKATAVACVLCEMTFWLRSKTVIDTRIEGCGFVCDACAKETLCENCDHSILDKPGCCACPENHVAPPTDVVTDMLHEHERRTK